MEVDIWEDREKDKMERHSGKSRRLLGQRLHIKGIFYIHRVEKRNRPNKNKNYGNQEENTEEK